MLLVAVVAVLRPISALLFAPWAIGIDGGPTLTGTWVGPMRSKWGSEYYIYLDLGWEPPRGRTPRARLTGEAWICNRAGKEFRLEVSGDADRQAQNVRIDAEARDSRYRESLPLRGAWNRDTLRLTAFTSPFGPEGELRGSRSTVSSSTSDAAGRFLELYPTGPARIRCQPIASRTSPCTRATRRTTEPSAERLEGDRYATPLSTRATPRGTALRRAPSGHGNRR
jgi:hypothetical protein